MGVFDYVELGSELKERLGKYGGSNYQTKYMVEEGFIRVYNGFNKYYSLWRLHVWIELLVEPKPSKLDMEPILRTVRLDEIGSVKFVDVSVVLSTHIFDIDGIKKRIRELGFKGPEKRERVELRHVTERICTLYLRNGKVELERVKVKDDKTPLGIKTLIKIRGNNVEVMVEDSGTVIRINGSGIHVERQGLESQKILEEEWVKDIIIEDVKADARISIVYGVGVAGTTSTMDIKGYMRLDYQTIREDLIDRLVELVENTAEKILL